MRLSDFTNIHKLFFNYGNFVSKPTETNMLDDCKMNVNSCANIFFTDAIIESIISNAVANEAGYSLSSIIPHNVSMKSEKDKTCSRELFEGLAVSPQATGKQLSASRSRFKRSPLFKPMR